MPEIAYDPEHPCRGWQPAIPLPYWRRPWWRLFRLTPSCYLCNGRAFRSVLAYQEHYRAHHLTG